MKKTIFLVTILAAGLLLFGPVPQAAALTFGLSEVFSDGPSPDGTPPWLTAEFTANGTNSVRLTLESNLPVGFFSDVYFNTNMPVSLTGIENNSYTNPAPQFFYGENSYKADGDGYFDIKLVFVNRNNAPNNQFKGTDSIDIILYGDGLIPESFDFSSLYSGGEGVWKAAAHVQDLAGGASTWIGDGFTPVPEPATMLLLGSGLLGLAGFGRKKIFSK